MANMADEYGTDVETYTKALTTTIHADTLAGLQDLLEQLGLERHEHSTGEPLHVLLTVPDRLDSDEQKSLANRAIPPCSLPDTRSTATPRSSTRPSTSRPWRARPTPNQPAPASGA
ncbi:hypothetical protein [Streptomyces tendae]|uniref:hypothetical protein n=1 Tax=Streptomyces tendae TaxID=1932 RepID=UPI00366930B0